MVAPMAIAASTNAALARAPNEAYGGTASSAGSEDATDQRKGRSRRIGSGNDHHRPENRHAPDRAPSGAGTTTTGLGHNASVAAMIATTSSSVGTGEIDETAGERSATTITEAHHERTQSPGPEPCARLVPLGSVRGNRPAARGGATAREPAARREQPK